MKVLITGITGFVGSHLAEYILNNHPDVDVLGLVRWRAPEENIKDIKNKIQLCSGDLTDLSSLKEVIGREQPSIIFHLAAQSYVDFSFLAPAMTLETNIIGTCHLLEAIRDLRGECGYDPIVHICSSSEVYGQVEPDETPIRETNPMRPASPYAVSKVGEDMLAYQYFKSWNIKTIRTRMFTHTGPRQGDVFVTSTFAKQIAAIEAGITKEPVIRVGNLDSIRTFFDVRDAVRAYWILVHKCEPGEVYNIGGVETLTIQEMLYKLIYLSPRAHDIRIEIDPARLRPSDVTRQILCADKFTQATGWKPEIPFDKTLEDILNYWRNYYALKKDNTLASRAE